MPNDNHQESINPGVTKILKSLYRALKLQVKTHENLLIGFTKETNRSAFESPRPTTDANEGAYAGEWGWARWEPRLK